MSRRLLTAGLCILNLGIAYLYLRPMRTSPVWDLPQFYFASKLIRAGEISELHNKAAYAQMLADLQRTDEKAARYSTYFNRPAFEALLFLPLAWCSYRTASIAIIAANCLLLIVLIWKLPRWLNAPAASRVWLLVFMPFLHSLAYGQDTLLLTLIVAYALYSYRRGQDVRAGALLALGLFKPHVIWAVPIALAAGKNWKMLRGFLAVGGFLALFSAALVGPRGLMDWIHLLQEPSTDAVPHLMMNLRALILQWGKPAGILAAVTAAVSFAAVLKRGSFADRCSAALLAGLLFSPHTYIQDYSLVVIPALTSPYRLARYMFLLPWPFFWPGNHLLPFTLLALLHLILLAVHPLLPRLVHPRPPMQANVDGSVAVQTAGNEADALETSGHLHRSRARTAADCTREGAVP